MIGQQIANLSNFLQPVAAAPGTTPGAIGAPALPQSVAPALLQAAASDKSSGGGQGLQMLIKTLFGGAGSSAASDAAMAGL